MGVIINVGKIDISSNFLAKMAFSNPPSANTIAVKRTKEKMLEAKRRQAEKKKLRAPVEILEDEE